MSHSLEVSAYENTTWTFIHYKCETWMVGICFVSYVIVYQVPLGASAGWVASLVDTWSHLTPGAMQNKLLAQGNNSN